VLSEQGVVCTSTRGDWCGFFVPADEGNNRCTKDSNNAQVGCSSIATQQMVAAEVLTASKMDAGEDYDCRLATIPPSHSAAWAQPYHPATRQFSQPTKHLPWQR
jgi:hypothetical protein